MPSIAPGPALVASRLGATLYLPATRADLHAVVSGRKFPGLRSLVVCLEDAVAPRDIDDAFANLKQLLARLAMLPRTEDAPLLFVRPRDAALLARIVQLPGADAIDGYVIPKATADSWPHFLAALGHSSGWLMPTIETREAFDPEAMRALRALLLRDQVRVLAIRIGGNDLLQTLGTRRPPHRTAYDGPLGHVIASLVCSFMPWGFAMSAPVFERFDDPALLAEEVARDLEHGLATKTAIHPAQVETIHAAYRVPRADHDAALAICAHAAPAVFAVGGAMCEPATHQRWAEAVLARATTFGTERSWPEHVPIAV
jgi:citrate lyase beta subunit